MSNHQQDEYSTPIEALLNNNQQMNTQQQQQMNTQQQQQMNTQQQMNNQQMNNSQQQINNQQQMNNPQQMQQMQQMQQQQMVEQQMNLERMRNQLNQEEMLKNVQSSTNTEKFSMIFSKVNNTTNLKEVMVISILYIILSSSFYKTTISKYLTFITVTNNEFNTFGLLITAILMSVLFVIFKILN